MNKISHEQVSFLKLILRSADVGDGWRQCSFHVYPLAETFKHPELLELNEGAKQVRLSARGLVVADYI